MDTDTMKCLHFHSHMASHLASAIFPTCAVVRAVRERADEDADITYRQIGGEFGSSESQIHSVVTGALFRECGGPISAANRHRAKSKPAAARRLTDEQVAQARRDAANGAPLGPIAIELGIDRSALSRAVHGKTYKHIIDPPPVKARGYNRRAPVGAQE